MLLIFCVIAPSFTIGMNNTCPANVAASATITHNHALTPYPQSTFVPYTQKTCFGNTTHHQQERRTKKQTKKQLTANDKAHILSDKINKHVFRDSNSNNLANKLSRSIVNNY